MTSSLLTGLYFFDEIQNEVKDCPMDGSDDEIKLEGN